MSEPRPKIHEEEPDPGFLDGMAPEKNAKVHGLAKKLYAQARTMKTAKKEHDETRDRLLYVMGEEGLKHYQYGDIVVDVNDKASVKIKFAPVKDKPKKKPRKKKDAAAE